MLDTLLTTLIRELQNESIPGRQEEANNVARRFVRSVARIFVIFTIEMAPNTAKRRRYENVRRIDRVQLENCCSSEYPRFGTFSRAIIIIVYYQSYERKKKKNFVPSLALENNYQ